MSDIPLKHKELAPKELGFAVVVVSTSKSKELKSGKKVEDISGRKAIYLIEKNGYKVNFYKIVPDVKLEILRAVIEALTKNDVNVLVTIGGTGLSTTDMTVETLRPIFDKEIEGFGDVFRYLSFKEIKSSSYLSRATAGVIAGKVIYCLPGSPNAVVMALEKLILPEVGHLIYIARRDIR